MTLSSIALGNLLLTLIGVLIVWLVYTVHEMKGEVKAAAAALDVRNGQNGKDHQRYDAHLEDHRIHVRPR